MFRRHHGIREDLDIDEQFAGRQITTQRVQRRAVVQGRGHPDLIVRDDRRRPAFPGQRGFPLHIFRLAPR